MDNSWTTPLEALSQGYCTIFPNERSKELWMKKFFSGDACGNAIFSSLQAMTFQELVAAYLARDPRCFHYQIIDPHQAFFYHSSLLHQWSAQNEHHLDVEKTLQAVDLIAKWRVPVEKLRYFSLSTVEKSFYDYFVFYLEKRGCRRLLYELLGEFIENSTCVQFEVKGFCFWALDDINPLQQAFLELLGKKHHLEFSLSASELSCQRAMISQVTYQHHEEELDGALSWLKEQPKDKLSSIVLPSLGRDYKGTFDAVEQFFQSDNKALPLQGVSDEYVISHGLKSLEYPIIAQTCSFLTGENTASPYFSSAPNIDAKIFSQQFSAIDWVQFVHEQLEQAAWCQDLILSSVEYQTRCHFLSILDSLMSMNAVLGKHSYNIFLSFLTNIFQSLIFQAESSDKCSKMILGLLEAAALPLDQVFLIGTSEQMLLGQICPHQYINADLAKELLMPHAHWKKEVDYMTVMIRRLLSDKPCMISFSKTLQEKGSIGQSSALIAEITQNSTYDEQIVPAPDCAHLEKVYLSTIVHWPNDRWSLSDFNAYYKCPFAGFMKKFSLPVTPKECIGPLTPKEQGIFFHEYLQACIEKRSLKPILSTLAGLPEVMRQNEIKRAQRVYEKTKESLNLEEFLVEHSWTRDYGHLRLTGRYDLYHRTGESIVDFKSKNFAFSSWFSENPADIQGPVYALYEKTQVLGVIKASAQKGAVMKMQEVQPYQEAWESLVASLLKDIKKASVKPQPRLASHCRQCVYKEGCRYAFS